MMSLRQLQAFRAVIDHRTATEAARALNLSQPALSKLISNLEQETRLRLFLRERQRLVPTPEAMVLYDNAVRIFEGLTDLTRLSEELRSVEGGRLCIASISALGRELLPDTFVDFLADHGKAKLTLRAHSEHMVIDWVMTKQADLGFTMSPVDHPTVEMVDYFKVPAVCVLPPGHRLARRSRIRAEDLQGEAFIPFTPDTRMRRMVDGVLEAHGVEIATSVDTYMSEQACLFVARGLGVSIVDPITAWLHAVNGSVVVRPFLPRTPYTFRLLQPRNRPRSQLADRFLVMLGERIPRYLKERGIPLIEFAGAAGA